MKTNTAESTGVNALMDAGIYDEGDQDTFTPGIDRVDVGLPPVAAAPVAADGILAAAHARSQTARGTKEAAILIGQATTRLVGKIPMSETVTIDDPISHLLGESVWAVDKWLGDDCFAPQSVRELWRDPGGGMLVFTRWYPASRVLVDKFPREGKEVTQEVGWKIQAIRAYNATHVDAPIGYIPLIVDTEIDIEDIEAAMRGEIVPLRTSAENVERGMARERALNGR